MNLTFLVGLVARPSLEGELAMPWEEFTRCADAGLPGHVVRQLHRLRRLVDLENVRAFFAHEPLNPCGNWTDGMARSPDRGDIDPYFCALFDGYNSETFPPAFPGIAVKFFEDDEAKFGSGNFVGAHFRCELALRWSLANLRAERRDPALRRDIEEIGKSDRVEFLERCLEWVAEMHPDFLVRVHQIYRLYEKEPLQLLRGLCEWRLTYIEELLMGNLLSVDRLLGSCAQLMICAEWRRMDRKQGLQALGDMRASDELKAAGIAAQQ